VAGAAAASSIAYSLSLVLSLAVYSRMSGRGVWEAVLVRREDLRMYLDAARSLRGRYALQSGPGASSGL
jgi:hypothetical protein